MSKSYPIDLNKDLLCDWPDGGIRRRRDGKKDLPVNLMQEFIAYAKENPGKLNFGISGASTC